MVNKYTVMPCAVKVSISCFDRVKSSIATPAIVAERPCPEADSGNLDVSLFRLQLESFGKRHLGGFTFGNLSDLCVEGFLRLVRATFNA